MVCFFAFGYFFFCYNLSAAITSQVFLIQYNANIQRCSSIQDIKPDFDVTFTDSFSSIAWANNLPNILATTSWDGTLRIFQVTVSPYSRKMTQKIIHNFGCPTLRCTWNDLNNQIYVGLMDGAIKVYDTGSGQVADIGRHNSAINSLQFSSNQNILISTGYENIVNFWQPGNLSAVFSLDAGNKIYTSDCQFPTVVAATVDEKIMIVDATNTNSRSIVDSDLGKTSQIESIALNSKGTSFGIGSFDGRANISNICKSLNGRYSAKSQITFKSNKEEIGNQTFLYPINSVSFNPLKDSWFMTAGSDGGMHLWDFEAKTKIKSLSYGSPICCARISPRGDMLAYGLGNDWHKGQDGKQPTKLGVHMIIEGDLKFQK